MTNVLFFCRPLMVHDNNARNVLMNAIKRITKYTTSIFIKCISPPNVKNFDLVSSILADYELH